MSDVYTVIIAPEAMAEVVMIATWWNENRPAAPRLFQTELHRAVLRLAERNRPICDVAVANEHITSAAGGNGSFAMISFG